MAVTAGTFAGEMPFDRKVFDELRAAGTPVVVHVHEKWCGTCKKQARIVTPTLGAASTLAFQGQDLAQVSLLIMIFGLGAATPLAALGSLSRARMQSMRGKLQAAGKYGKYALGGIMIVLSIFILSGVDKSMEGLLVQISPDWLMT